MGGEKGEPDSYTTLLIHRVQKEKPADFPESALVAPEKTSQVRSLRDFRECDSAPARLKRLSG